MMFISTNQHRISPFAGRKNAEARVGTQQSGSLGDRARLHGNELRLRPFTNEELVGEAVAPFRGQVLVATKFGFDIDTNTGQQRGLNSRPEHIKQVAASAVFSG